MKLVLALNLGFQEAALAFPKTHDLLELLKRVLAVEPGWTILSPALNQLVNYAVVFRYPGISASKADARKARTACRMVRGTVRRSLGLKD
jgi:hypothetical protein